MTTLDKVVGGAPARVEGREKVTGAAHYAYEYPVPNAVYVWPVQSTIARGRVRAVHGGAALALPGVIAVLDSGNVSRLHPVDDAELAVLQSADVAYRGQIVAAVVASTLEGAREAASAVRVDYDEQEHDVVLSPGSPRIFSPRKANAGFTGTVDWGDAESALAAAPVGVDAAYTTPAEHASPMEPHATIAFWEGETLTLYNADQAPWMSATAIAALFGLADGAVSIVADHVGGGFGSKAVPRPPTVLAALAARAVGRPVKVAMTRQQMFPLVSYRTPTVQRVRLGADRDGRLTAVWHDALQQSSKRVEYTEQTVAASRMMYATPNSHTAHRLLQLDVPTPSWMRAPGEAPGMFALESAMDELAYALGMDPVELRIVNEPAVDPESGLPFSSRNLLACLREGAARFGWAGRDPTPGVRRDGRWLVGTGVASSTYPVFIMASTATARAEPMGRFVVEIAAADIGTGARTALAQVAADELGVPMDQVTILVGRSVFGPAPFAGGSMGTASWSWAVSKVCRALARELDERSGVVPAEGLQARADTTADLAARGRFSRHSFGAQFAEVKVDVDSGQVRIERLLGVFAAGRIVNARTARSQFLGGMTMGISMALHEALRMDPRFGDFANHDLATYHIASNADVRGIEAHWIDEHDDELNPVGVKGIGEVGIVGTAAAIANAVFHATGSRQRDLPITLDRVRAAMHTG
ncbi:xanthine dehydrogenase family protein molybdopterin-binding subunit [Streptosporangium sp. NBC_01755]|uniref:xanthine dehydrogenase family protein molybdopterin-binding subunit n=1 Tax=unclassified Streptosporangium TaxID=2632669 RepID=UPI002DD9F488|nr:MULTISPECIES: xanthine dehydrogenase family protein molybdopterin-binding subunit [unclassified Streptosporangium]WSA24497.1 xanthine dehydrogenase family protein molybdopterin-binding subunit [Streptosporangium sp. NBC_01810]WSC97429.1 xanthine dehydrogenase family protein molybdopterin-binding subunit [Streptosporangium sp. NBC_01755]